MKNKPRRKHLKPPGSCIFCGSPGLTQEHIFSEWMHPFFPLDARYSRNGVMTSGFVPVGDKYKYSVQQNMLRQGSIFTKKLKVVCGKRDDTTKCNNTWMSGIEEAAKPYLIPLFRGEQITLNRQQQLSVVAWIALKTVIAEYFFVNNIAITKEERTYIWKYRMPPLHWRIWIGRYQGTKWKPARYSHHGFKINFSPTLEHYLLSPKFEEQAQCNSQSSTFVIGDLFIHVISSVHHELVSRFQPNLQQLWPSPKEPFLHLIPQKIIWPSEIVINDDWADFIDSCFHNSYLPKENIIL
jgi:hypothetical protein